MKSFCRVVYFRVMADQKPECFVIAPIGTEKSDVRSRSDQILKHVIRPVAEECGYYAIRSDEISEPGSITTQVINHILNAPVLVADLTGNNANVFYELAVRHAIRKPYVQIVQKGERIPFDVAGLRTIEINHNDLDSVAAAKEEIRKQIQFTTANATKIDSPITAAVDLAALTQSENPLEQRMAEVLTSISELKLLLDDRLPAQEWRPIMPTGTHDLARAIAFELGRSGQLVRRASPIAPVAIRRVGYKAKGTGQGTKEPRESDTQPVGETTAATNET